MFSHFFISSGLPGADYFTDPERISLSLSLPRPFLSFARVEKDKLWTLKASVWRMPRK